jgi:hypothetical protein
VVNNITINRVNVHRTNVTNIYGRWDRHAVARVRGPEPARLGRVNAPERGRGYITRPDGSRRDFGGDRRRDDFAGRHRNGTNPPAIQGPARRGEDGPRADRAAPRGELPRIQGQNRRWNRDDARAGNPGGDRPQWRRDGEPRNPRGSVTERGPVAGVPRPQAQGPGGDMTRPERREWRSQERREFGGNEGNRWQQRRESAARSRDIPDRRTVAPQAPAPRVQAAPQAPAPRVQAAPQAPAPRVQAAPQAPAPRIQAAPQASAPRVQAPRVQAPPRVQQAPQAQSQRWQQRSAPERRAAAPQARPRAERPMEGRSARQENRGGGGHREFRANGGGFRPDAR